MKKLFKNIPVLIAIATVATLLSFKLYGQVIIGQPSFANQTFATNILAATTNALITNATEVTSITLLAGGTGNETVALFDSALGKTVWTNAAYTNYATYSSNLVVTSTNAQGIITTNTYTGVAYSLVVTNAAATNAMVPAVVVTVPAGAQSTVLGRWDFARGVTATNASTNVTVILNYRRLF
jgi:hypothetical protein